MVLHPEDLAAQIIETHKQVLGLVHGYLDMSVSKAFATADELADRDLQSGAFVATATRQRLVHLARNPTMNQMSLSLRTRPNIGVWLERRGLRIRIREHPRDLATGRPIPVSFIDPLFGDADWLVPPFEAAVLWQPDMRGRCLASASLAIVENLDKVEKVAIHAELPLPLETEATLPSAAPAGTAEADWWDETDDFGDVWSRDETAPGPDPA